MDDQIDTTLANPLATVSSLQLRFENLRCSKASISPPNSSPIYNLEWHTRKPHLRFFSSPANAPLAEANFHTFSYKIDVTFPSSNNTIQISPKRAWTRKEFSYTSPTHPAGQLTWRRNTGWKQQRWVCLDENSLPLAQVALNSWAWKDVAEIEFAGEGASQALREELMVTGVALCILTILVNSGTSVSVTT